MSSSSPHPGGADRAQQPAPDSPGSSDSFDCDVVCEGAPDTQQKKPVGGAACPEPPPQDVPTLTQQPAGLKRRAAAAAAASSPPAADDAAAAAAEAAAAEAAAAAPAAAAAKKPRTYYVDWLRVFLTVLVVVHHSVTVYSSTWVPWAAKKGDTPLWLLMEYFVSANQTYFMTLFFFISGIYVPGSYRRKGPWRFLFDRTLRLVIPCVVYSLLVPPFIVWLADTAKNGAAAKSMAQQFRDWLKPGWPSQYNLPVGPPWFLWMLWWFNVAYVVLQLLHGLAARLLAGRRRGAAASGADLEQGADGGQPKQRGGGAVGPAAECYSDRQCILYGGGLVALLASVMFGSRAFAWMVFQWRPAMFFVRGPFVSFMPDFLLVYAIAFALGLQSGPSGWDLLPRLPRHWGTWLLAVAGVWWTCAGWTLNIMLGGFANPGRAPSAGAMLGVWALRAFVEQGFAVAWSVGLLILFREQYNVKPAWVGLKVIGAAYGAYLVHWPLVNVFGRLLMSIPWPSSVVAAPATALPTVLSAWLLAALLKAIPGADHIL